MVGPKSVGQVNTGDLFLFFHFLSLYNGAFGCYNCCSKERCLWCSQGEGIEDVRRNDHLRLHFDSQVAAGHRRRPSVAESEEGWVEEEEGQPSLRRGGDGGRLRGRLPGVRQRVRRVGGKRRGGARRRSVLCFPSQRSLCSREKLCSYLFFYLLA